MPMHGATRDPRAWSTYGTCLQSAITSLSTTMFLYCNRRPVSGPAENTLGRVLKLAARKTQVSNEALSPSAQKYVLLLQQEDEFAKDAVNGVNKTEYANAHLWGNRCGELPSQVLAHANYE